MSYRLSILPRAAEDVQAIYRWLEDHSPSGAVRWYFAFETAAIQVLQDPDSYTGASESARLDQDVREFRFKTPKGRTYRGIYLIRGDEVCILRVRGPGQADLSSEDL